ncbi:MAG: gamma-glutamylcyclotransferase [Pseudomonadota bacterium]
MSDFWVFGYGSLMWNPGFETIKRSKAVMHGVHRALCIHSWVHRGTQKNPGLVLGLDRGGSCHGVGLKVDGQIRESVIEYLRARELVTRVYIEQWRCIRLETGERVQALTYLVDRDHVQYAGRMSDHEICEIISRSSGKSGKNIDYVVNTVDHLRETGIHDPHLEAVIDEYDDNHASAGE